MEKNSVYVGAIGTANPPCKISQHQAALLVQSNYEGVLRPRSMEMLLQAIRHPSIESRYFAVDSPEDIVVLKDEDPDKRIERFTRWSVDLAVTATKKAMASAGVAAEEISALIVNTCTGYLCPGIATYCLEPLNLRPDTLAFDLVGSGCGGALANLMMGAGLLKRDARSAVVCISVEICTATYQMGDDPSLLISNAIFGDGAAAAILWREPRGFRLHASASRFLPKNRDDVRYIYKNGQLHNRITMRLPAIINRSVPEFIRDFLNGQGLSSDRVGSWALHPGGDKMVAGIQKELALSDAQTAPTRSVLKEYGNMSSPTVLFVLERIMRANTAKNEWCLACAYGAGLSMHLCLLQQSKDK
jgi:predicted naringenin-chalcone synthase